jgi:hypothetical protein
MSLWPSLKSNAIAYVVEKDLKSRLVPEQWRHFKTNYGSTTEVGLLVFNEIAVFSKSNKLNEAEDYIFALIILHNTAEELMDIFGATYLYTTIVLVEHSLRSSLTSKILDELDHFLTRMDPFTE